MSPESPFSGFDKVALDDKGEIPVRMTSAEARDCYPQPHFEVPDPGRNGLPATRSRVALLAVPPHSLLPSELLALAELSHGTLYASDTQADFMARMMPSPQSAVVTSASNRNTPASSVRFRSSSPSPPDVNLGVSTVSTSSSDAPCGVHFRVSLWRYIPFLGYHHVLMLLCSFSILFICG